LWTGWIAITWYVFTVQARPFYGYISKSDRIRPEQLWVSSSSRSTRTNKQAVSSRSTSEYEKSAVWFEDFMCAVVQWYWECLI
jgi:hypothetical protein